MPIMEWGKMADDVGEPTGLVARRKQDGTIQLIMLDGDDEETNDAVAAMLVSMETKADIAEYVAAQKAVSLADGVDLDEVLQDRRDGKDWQKKAKDLKSGKVN